MPPFPRNNARTTTREPRFDRLLSDLPCTGGFTFVANEWPKAAQHERCACLWGENDACCRVGGLSAVVIVVDWTCAARRERAPGATLERSATEEGSTMEVRITTLPRGHGRTLRCWPGSVWPAYLGPARRNVRMANVGQVGEHLRPTSAPASFAKVDSRRRSCRRRRRAASTICKVLGAAPGRPGCGWWQCLSWF